MDESVSREQHDAVVAQLAAANARIAELEQQVAKLVEEKGRNSSNSNKPPSSDSPKNRAERRAAKAKERSGKKRGGQPGHEGSQRALVVPDQVEHHFPDECENCFKPLPKTPDASPLRYQTTELPPVKPHTLEHQVHCVTCLHCRHKTTAVFEIPPGFGPRLWSVIALLTGVFHMSRRSAGTLLSDVLGVEISLGALSSVEARVSEAVAPAVEEAWQHVIDSDVKHTDGTSWYQAGASRALWVIASATATVFKILASGSKDLIEPLFRKRKRGVLVSDRAAALMFWSMHMRQICWAHLLRKFIAFSERGGAAATLGRELLDYVKIMFAYWDDFRAGKLTREELRTSMAPVRVQVEALLQRGATSQLEHVAGSCEDIVAHMAALWTFVEVEGVDPTNNHGERELRAFVIWRKRCFGTQSDRGNVFAERLMTVAHTARKQKKNVLEFLVACCTAARDGAKVPSLFAA